MPPNRQITRPKQLSLSMPPSHSYTVTQSTSTQNDDDDDDICPVCESECTCRNNNKPQSTTSQHSSTPVLTTVPLTIKLPPRRALSPFSKTSATDRARLKKKQTTAGSATDDGSHNDYVLVHHQGSFSVLGHQFGAPLPVTSTSTTLSPRGSSPLTPEPELAPPRIASSNPKLSNTTTAPKNHKKAPANRSKPRPRHTVPRKKDINLKTRKVKDPTWTGTSARRKGKRPVETSSDEFEHNVVDKEDTFTRMAIDSDGLESVQFPTFISTISSTSGNDDTGSITSDSFDSDSSVRAEEEKMILVEERARVRRELLNGEDSWHMEKRKWDHLRNHNNWEIRPRKKSVGAGETESDTGSDSGSDVQTEEEEEEEEEGDDDDDADIGGYGRGMVTGWQSDDDDFDAELFFSTLTDSSGPGSDADAEDGEESGDDHSDDSDLSTISITEAAAAGLLNSSFEAGCPLVVTEDWDGRLVFANGLKDGQGVLDVHFEVDAAQRHRRIREAMEADVDETEENTLEGDEEELISDDGGETTDDILDHRSGISTPRGVVTLPFRCPTPPVTSIDPLSTLSPISSAKRKRLIKSACAVNSPKPADILAGVSKISRDNISALQKSCDDEKSKPVSVAAMSPPETVASSSSHSRQMPSMGKFEYVPTDPSRRAIIDGSKTVVFSPYTRIKRVRKHLERGCKRSAHGSDIFPYTSKRPRQSSLPGSTRMSLTVDIEESDPLVQSSPELPTTPAAPIGLDDVLDPSFLDSDDSKEVAANTSGERHLRNLNRWDRIPMSTFRRSRSAFMDENGARAPALARHNDGVSYGSAGGHVLRKGPTGIALWQSNPAKNKDSRRTPVTIPVSPVIFPANDGERTPTAADQYVDLLQNPVPGDTGSSKSHKQKRKEKKRHRGTVHPSSIPTPIPPPNGSFSRPLSNVPPLNL